MACNPFALIQAGEPQTCPDLETVITPDDLISMIAFSDFDWKAFEEKMEK